jgi:hypothetical protein
LAWVVDLWWGECGGFGLVVCLVEGIKNRVQVKSKVLSDVGHIEELLVLCLTKVLASWGM